MLGAWIRRKCCRALAGESSISFEKRAPSREELQQKFGDIGELGIYLHIPFCRQICSYCPYNKELYDARVAKRYTAAVRREIDFYAEIIGNLPVTSVYVGGGTPTTMLHDGLAELLGHLRKSLNLQCDIHVESHPRDLTDANLDALLDMGVQHLSTGVESLDDTHLKFLGRPYSAREAREAVQRATRRDFTCVNADVIFALPRQSRGNVRDTGQALVDLGVDQVAAYPLFKFPYTAMGGNGSNGNYGPGIVWKRRRMLAILEKIFYSSGYERTSVWGFTRKGVPRYCSVTVPLYVGLGASGGTYLRDAFYLNTFRVAEYIESMESRGTAVALSLDLPERMQMAGWLYWRIYETRFRRSDFEHRFHRAFDSVYGKYVGPLRRLGFLEDDGQEIVLTDRGAYWLHAFEDIFSLEYVSRLWGRSRQDPWPEGVALEGTV